MNKRWFLALILPPIAIGLVLREVVSWRPRRIGVLGTGASQALRIAVSPDGKWLLSRFASVPVGNGAPRLLELATGRRRAIVGQFARRARWTSDSHLAFVEENPAGSRLVFLDPRTLKTSVVFSPAVAGNLQVLSWNESKGDVWLLTRRQRLRFDSHGRLLSRSVFGARPARALRAGEVDISPDGQNARARDFLWNLKINKRSSLRAPRQFQWVGNHHYFAGDKLMFVDVALDVERPALPKALPLLWNPGDDFFATASLCDSKVRFYNSSSAQLLESTRLPTLPFSWNSWAPSPDRKWMFVSHGDEIWRQRLK
jgi:hypothetical protein